MDIQGVAVGTLEVSDRLFGVPMNTSVVHQAMVGMRANARQGTSSTKTRAEVSGGGAKPRPQKHTGGARQGSIRAPQWRGGGIVFGPKPRSYRHAMPKKMRRLAIRCLVSDKTRENQLTLLDDFEAIGSKTQEMKRVLETLDANSSVLLVTHEVDKKVVLSARNIQRVKTLPAPNLNVLDLLDHDRVIMTVGAVRKIEELWGDGTTSGEIIAIRKAVSKRPVTEKRSPRTNKIQKDALENGEEV